ncbi:MAG TPA: alpha/beta hydrolase [Ignavibacteriales bacterium]|nr:alpha/beta hydrolase [Ignavibacteriales bacterium]HPD66956.1 alpha/beta hydrolase [Ignavibacteriales bacterium]HRR19344.1 alpha/beta hydrolase [Ignavibacteriales bacterium]
MKKLFFVTYLLIPFIFTSCTLDNFLFNPNTTEISEYKFDNYRGEVDFILDSTYTIPQNKIHLFTLNSAGNTIYAIYIGDLNTIVKDTVIMYCHGNKDHMDFYWQRAKLLANVGGKNRYGVMMIDYRGYGLSSGKPTENGLYEDVDAALLWLKNKGLTNERLIIYGFSMGTAPATELTAKPRSLIPSKIILEAPFASAQVMVQDATKLAIPGKFVTNLKIDNAAEIKKVTQPFLWLHGTNDDFLSIKTHGEIVFKNYPNPNTKYSIRVSGANHSNVPLIIGFNKYCEIINNFINNKPIIYP